MSRAITSLTNPTVKAVRALHMRKAREESGQFLMRKAGKMGEGIFPAGALHPEINFVITNHDQFGVWNFFFDEFEGLKKVLETFSHTDGSN